MQKQITIAQAGVAYATPRFCRISRDSVLTNGVGVF